MYGMRYSAEVGFTYSLNVRGVVFTNEKTKTLGFVYTPFLFLRVFVLVLFFLGVNREQP